MKLISIYFLLATGAVLAAWSGGLISGIVGSAAFRDPDRCVRERVAAFALALTSFFICVSGSHFLFDATSETSLLALAAGSAIWLGGVAAGFAFFARESSRRHFPAASTGALIFWWGPRDEAISGTDLFLFGGFAAWIISLVVANRRASH